MKYVTLFLGLFLSSFSYAGWLSLPIPYGDGGTNNSSSYTTGSIVFAGSSSLIQDNSQFFWDDSALGLRVGTNAVINASGIEGVSAQITGTTPTAGIAFPYAGKANITGDTAQVNTTGVFRASYARTITTTAPTESEVTSLYSSLAPVYTVPSGQTLTNTNSVGYTALNIALSPTISGGGGLAFTNWAGVTVAASATNTGSYKNDLKLGAPTGASNNAYIADNSAYTGSYFINSTSTNASLFSGQIQASGGVGIGATVLISQTAPTISSGFATSGTTVSNNNGTAAFTITVGSTVPSNSGVIGLPTASHGWACFCADITTTSTTVFQCKQTATTTTSATIANFNTAAVSAAQAWTASDILSISCHAY